MYDNDSSTKTTLSDILENGTGENLAKQWTATEAAGDFAPLPAGTYAAHVNKLELFNAKTGTPGVKLQFKIAEGDYAGQYIFHDLWLTAAALPQTKRDCAKLRLMTLEKLESATIPPGRIRCKVRVALRTGDDGEKRNCVRRFDVVRIDEPECDPFAPTDDDTEDSGEAPLATPSPSATLDAPSLAVGDSRFDFPSEPQSDTPSLAVAGNDSAGGNGAVAAPATTQQPGTVEGGDGDEVPF